MKLSRFKFGIVIAGTLLGALAGVWLEELSHEGPVSAGPSYYPDFDRHVNFIKCVLAGAAVGLVIDTIVNGLPTLKRFSLRQLMLAVAACAMACYVAGQIWEAFRPRRY
jgi:F0F1-type ATP synthase assembly protein I